MARGDRELGAGVAVSWNAAFSLSRCATNQSKRAIVRDLRGRRDRSNLVWRKAVAAVESQPPSVCVAM